jgi:hypothetical protein
MEDVLPLQHKADVTMSRGRKIHDEIKPKGRFHVEHWREGKLLNTYDFPNDIVDAGVNALFNIMFDSGTQITAWYIGLISISSYSALSNSDTMASHAGWTEATGYTESTRVSWGAGSASARSITNSSPATFDINATDTIKGVFVTSQNSKSGTTGTLWATALFSADVPVTSGDQLRITYTVSA